MARRGYGPAGSGAAAAQSTHRPLVSLWEYLDPDTTDDPLPQPYRMVSVLVKQLVEESIDASERIYFPPPDPNLRKDPLLLKQQMRVWPSSFKWEEAPAAPVAAISGTGERSPIIFAASVEGEIHALDVARRRTVKRYTLPAAAAAAPGAGPDRVLCMAVCNLAPGCNALAAGTASGRVLLLAAYHLQESEEPFTLLAALQAGTGRAPGALAFAPDGAFLSVSYEDGGLEPAAPGSKPGTAVGGTKKDAAAAAAAAAAPAVPATPSNVPTLVLSVRSPPPPPGPAGDGGRGGRALGGGGAPAGLATVHFVLGRRAAGGPAGGACDGLRPRLVALRPALYRFRLAARPAVAPGAECEAPAAAAEAALRMPFRVTASCLSRDTGLAALGLADGSLLLLEALTGLDGPPLRRHAAAVTALALHGARFLLSGAADGRVHVYDLDPAAGPPPVLAPPPKVPLQVASGSVSGSNRRLGSSRNLAAGGALASTARALGAGGGTGGPRRSLANSTVSSAGGGAAPHINAAASTSKAAAAAASTGAFAASASAAAAAAAAAAERPSEPMAPVERAESVGPIAFAATVDRDAPLGLASWNPLRREPEPGPAGEPGAPLFVPRAAVLGAPLLAAGAAELRGDSIVLLAEEYVPPPPPPTPEELAAAAAAAAEAEAQAAAAAAEAAAAAAKGGKGKGGAAKPPCSRGRPRGARGPGRPARPAALPTRLMVYSQSEIEPPLPLLAATAATARGEELHSTRSRRGTVGGAGRRRAAPVAEAERGGAEEPRATRKSLPGRPARAGGGGPGPGRAGGARAGADAAARVQAALQEREVTREARAARAKARGEELLAALERERAATAAERSRARAAALAKSPSARLAP
eukprot:tig00000025_g7943.t1